MAKKATQSMIMAESGPSVNLDTVITELRVLNTTDRLLGLYELGIDGCENRDADQVNAILDELIGALDFEYADIAQGFHRLYTYCLERTRDGAFDQVGFILQDLRDTLARAVSDAPIETPLSRAAGA